MQIFSLIGMVALFAMLLISAYIRATGENWKRKLGNSFKWTLPVFQTCLLIMVIPMMKTSNFVILYPLVIAVYLRLCAFVSGYEKPQLLTGILTAIVAILVLLVSGGWVLLSVLMVSSVINLVFLRRL